MLKSELAREAGVSRKTLNNWCKPYMKELVKMGYRPTMKMLPPNIVEFKKDKFCI
jgi:DNA-binding XRE family transcriptional regulator